MVFIHYTQSEWQSQLKWITERSTETVVKLSIFIPSVVLTDYNKYISNSLPPPYIMRQIEKQMNNAIRNKRNFSKSNTMVSYDAAENLSSVFLHGNRIADFDHAKGKAWISSCGWTSVTTKSRLNAFLDEVAYGVSVFQKNWQWFLHDRRTTATIDFYDNMVVFSKPLTLSDV